MSPTAYRRNVWVGCCSSPRCRLHDTTWTESSSTPITKPSFEPSTAYQPGKRLSRVHEAGSRTGSIRVAVEKLDAPPEQRPRRPVRNRAELRLGSGNVEPAQSHHDDLGRERSEEHTSELQSHSDLVCRLLLEKKKNIAQYRGRLPNPRGELSQ